MSEEPVPYETDLDEEAEEPTVTDGPYQKSQVDFARGRTIAKIMSGVDNSASDQQAGQSEVVSTRHKVEGDEPQMNAELILAAFNLAYALRHSDRDPIEVIQQAAAIVERDEDEQGQGDVMNPAPESDQVTQQMAGKPKGQQHVAIASNDDKLFLYFNQPMKSLALSKEEGKSFVGNLLNHIRGNV